MTRCKFEVFKLDQRGQLNNVYENSIDLESSDLEKVADLVRSLRVLYPKSDGVRVTYL